MDKLKTFQGILIIFSLYLGVRVYSLRRFTGFEPSEIMRERQYILSLPDQTPTAVPFDPSVMKLFPDPVVKPVKDKEAANDYRSLGEIPALKYIGVIETGNKIYSFRDMHTDKLILLEAGRTAAGITLLSVTSRECILEVNGKRVKVIRNE